MVPCVVRHDRSEIGPADPDVDNGAHVPACVTAPAANPDEVGEVGHPIEDFVYVGHDIAAIEDDRCATRRSKRHMEHRTSLK